MELSRYEILEPLGAGGMSEVFLARMRGVAGVDRLVAIKRMLPERLGNQAMQEMFIDEARISARLRHSNIAQTLEFGKDQGYYFIVMEYVHGLSLYNITRRQDDQHRLAPPVAAFITARLCEALQYAHTLCDAKGQPLEIVHRDLNPGNVMVTHHGEVKLIDFGIARATTRVHQTMVGVVKGAVGYMSPEQVSCAPIDHRSDIFVAGTTLLELLLGKNPFLRESKEETLADIRKVVIEPLDWTSRIPRSLAAVCTRALARKPQDRYASAGDLQEDLDRYCHGEGFGSRQLASWMANHCPELGAERMLQTSSTAGIAQKGGTQVESEVIEPDVSAAYAETMLAPPSTDGESLRETVRATGPLPRVDDPTVERSIATVSLRPAAGVGVGVQSKGAGTSGPEQETVVARVVPSARPEAEVPTDPVDPPGRQQRAGHDLERRRRRVLANVMLMVVLVGVAGAIVWAIGWRDAGPGGRSIRRNSPQVKAITTKVLGADQGYGSAGRASQPATAVASPSGPRDAGVDGALAAAAVPAADLGTRVTEPSKVARRKRRRRRASKRRHRRRRVPKKPTVAKNLQKIDKTTKKKVELPSKPKNLGDKGAQW